MQGYGGSGEHSGSGSTAWDFIKSRLEADERCLNPYYSGGKPNLKDDQAFSLGMRNKERMAGYLEEELSRGNLHGRPGQAEKYIGRLRSEAFDMKYRMVLGNVRTLFGRMQKAKRESPDHADELAQFLFEESLKAAGRYDPLKGCKFYTYLSRTLDYILKIGLENAGRDRNVKIGVHMLKLIKRTKGQLTDKLGRPPRIGEVIEEIRKIPRKGKPHGGEYVDFTMTGSEVSLEHPGYEDGKPLGDLIGAPPEEGDVFRERNISGIVRKAIDSLPEDQAEYARPKFGIGTHEHDNSEIMEITGLDERGLDIMYRTVKQKLRRRLRSDPQGTAQVKPTAPANGPRTSPAGK